MDISDFKVMPIAWGWEIDGDAEILVTTAIYGN